MQSSTPERPILRVEQADVQHHGDSLTFCKNFPPCGWLCSVRYSRWFCEARRGEERRGEERRAEQRRGERVSSGFEFEHARFMKCALVPLDTTKNPKRRTSLAWPSTRLQFTHDGMWIGTEFDKLGSEGRGLVSGIVLAVERLYKERACPTRPERV
jgi:hypothetical protein